MAELDVRVILGHFLDDLAPQLAGGQDVGLVDRAELLAAHAGHVETDPGDTADFALAVWQGVVGLTLAACQLTGAAWRAEVDAAGQFANDENIQAGDDFRFQRRSVGQLRVEDRRAQVGEQAQLRTDLQQAALGANVALDLVPFRPANGAEQHGVGLACTFQGLVGQRHAVLVDGGATDHIVLQAEAELELVVGQLQNLDRLGHDFRTNAITWKNQNLLAHAFLYSIQAARPVGLPEKT
ncbi:hypothetical protein D3C77_503680 [compost metagenome]